MCMTCGKSSKPRNTGSGIKSAFKSVSRAVNRPSSASTFGTPKVRISFSSRNR